MMTQSINSNSDTKKLPQSIYLHQDVLNEISNQPTYHSSYAKRANLLIILLAAMGNIGFKGTQGINKGWRRSPCGGNDGSHYYLWWTKKHPELDHSSSILIRAIRHHDLTGEILDHGDLAKDYLLYEYMPNRNDFPEIWTEDQDRFIKENISIRLLKGSPGTGKTTSLWHAIENEKPSKLLYLTWSDQLAEKAGKYFNVTLKKDTIIDTINLKTFFSRLLDDDVKANELKQFDLKEAIANFKNLLDQKIKDHRFKNDAIKHVDLYYGLIRAWILGRSHWNSQRATQFSVQSQATSSKDQAIFASTEHDLFFKLFENESFDFQKQQVALYTAWDQVLQERLIDAKEIYQKLKLTEQEEIKLFPELTLAKRCLTKLQTQEIIPLDLCYEQIVIDEVQDLTPLEIAVLIYLCQRIHTDYQLAPHLLIAGDEGQIVRPTYFEWRELSLLLSHSLSKPFAITLQTNLRSPKLIVDLLDRFKRLYELKLPKSLHASGQVTPQSDLLTECLVGLTICQTEQDLLNFLEQMSSNPDVMIIDLCNPLGNHIRSFLSDRKEIIERIKTPEEVKGLEYSTICLINLSHALSSLSDQLAQKDPLAYFLGLNQLRVAFSRANQNLIIIEYQPNQSHQDQYQSNQIKLDQVVELILNLKQFERFGTEDMATVVDISNHDLKNPILVTQSAILDYLMLDEICIDERIAGILREVDREFRNQPNVAWRLLKQAESLMHENSFEDDDFQQEISIFQIRIAMIYAFDINQSKKHGNLQDEILSTIQSKLKTFEPSGMIIERLITSLFQWGSDRRNLNDLINVFQRLDSLDLDERLYWLKQDFGKYRSTLINAFTDCVQQDEYTEILDQEIERWFRLIGLSQDEAYRKSIALKRIVLDRVNVKKMTETHLQSLELSQSLQSNQNLVKIKNHINWHDHDVVSLVANGVNFNMIYCPKGEFWMGSNHERYKVKIGREFWIGETLVTQRLWYSIMGWNASSNRSSTKQPVTQITWYDCLVFCNKLSELHGFIPCFHLTDIVEIDDQIASAIVEWNLNANGYRLPTEAEWEYAAKSGTSTIYSGSNHINQVAWYDENSADDPHEVKMKKSNAWKLYDMSGNLWEWCMDQYDKNIYHQRSNGIENPILWSAKPCQRVVRGGSYEDASDFCKVTVRDRHHEWTRYYIRGVRLLRCEVNRFQFDKVFDEIHGHLSKQPKARDLISSVVNGVAFNMVYCPEGEFWMGTNNSTLKADYWNRSKPRHKVKISKGFWMGETLVTQNLWEKVMGENNHSNFKGICELPVDCVSWFDCLVFCNKLSELHGFTPCFNLKNIEKKNNKIKKAIVEWNRNANGYRLPTEAEWEYCAKAGTELIYSGSNHLDEVAWYDDNSRGTTHVVKTKKPNAWGLYDMSGNVWEWCMDKFYENAYKNRTNGNIENPILWNNDAYVHVLRGGAYIFFASVCRVDFRCGYIADSKSFAQGFRLLRSEPCPLP